ncbi:MAG: hypothetical protein L6277_01655 [Desulfobacterales bacterium]|nr:hypothetical protein [Desulfobacterales bacterium]
MSKGISGLWLRLGWGSKAKESVFAEKDEKELSQLPQELVDKAAPDPDWSAPLAAMTAVLDSWLDAKVPGSSNQIFVGPPYHGTSEILTAWAQARDWRLVSAPAPEMILTGGQEWLTQLEEDNEPLVLPHLEHCYLRHYDGLTLLRRLLDHIISQSRRWLVGCDSWAWAYLSKALKVDTVFPTPFILEAFDQERLKIWFQQLAAASGEDTFVFRQLDSGKYVLPPAAGDEASCDQSQGAAAESSGFLKNVAAYSRGIPGIAREVWRRSFGFVNTTKEDGEEIDTEAPAAGDDNSAYPIWVKPWSQLKLPGFPGQRASIGLLMVLHTLLIHGGLWSRILPELLPLSPMEILEYLYLLEASGLVESDQGFWRVTPAGYPVVRQMLQSEGYLTDAI